MEAKELTSERLVMKPLTMEFLGQHYVDWLNDPEVYKFLESGGDYSIEKLRTFLEEVERSKILFWAVVIKDTSKHIGNIKIDPINLKHSVGEYGILMGDTSEWGKGYAFEASQRILDYCFFEEPNIRKITLGVVLDNQAAIHVYKKLGFVEEGVYKQHALHGGIYRDVVRMALFNPSWK